MTRCRFRDSANILHLWLWPMVFVWGCSELGTGSRPCTTEARSGLQVEVRDSLTGIPVAWGAVVIASEGSYIDTLHYVPPYVPDSSAALLTAGVYERRGTYVVTVQKPGYKLWIRNGVVVSGDECHVFTTQLVARLERL